MTVERSRSSDFPFAMPSFPPLQDHPLVPTLFSAQLLADSAREPDESPHCTVLTPCGHDVARRCGIPKHTAMISQQHDRPESPPHRCNNGIHHVGDIRHDVRETRLPQSPLGGGRPLRRHTTRPDFRLRASSPPGGSPSFRAARAGSPLARARSPSSRTHSPKAHAHSSPRSTVPFKAQHHHPRNAHPAHILRSQWSANPLLAEIFSPHSAEGTSAWSATESPRRCVTPRNTARVLPDDFTAGEAPPSLAAEIPPTFWELPREEQQQGREALKGAGVFARLSVLMQPPPQQQQQQPPQPSPQAQWELEQQPRRLRKVHSLHDLQRQPFPSHQPPPSGQICRSADPALPCDAPKPGVLRRWGSLGRRRIAGGTASESVPRGPSTANVCSSGCHQDADVDCGRCRGGQIGGRIGFGKSRSGGSSGRDIPLRRLDLGQPLRLVRSLSTRMGERGERRERGETRERGELSDQRAIPVTCEGAMISGGVRTEAIRRRPAQRAKSEPLRPRGRRERELRKGFQMQVGEGRNGADDRCADAGGVGRCEWDGLGLSHPDCCDGHAGGDAHGANADDGEGVSALAADASLAACRKAGEVCAELGATVGGVKEAEARPVRPSVSGILTAALKGVGRASKEKDTSHRLVGLNSLSSIFPSKPSRSLSDS